MPSPKHKHGKLAHNRKSWNQEDNGRGWLESKADVEMTEVIAYNSDEHSDIGKKHPKAVPYYHATSPRINLESKRAPLSELSNVHRPSRKLASKGHTKKSGVATENVAKIDAKALSQARKKKRAAKKALRMTLAGVLRQQRGLGSGEKDQDQEGQETDQGYEGDEEDNRRKYGKMENIEEATWSQMALLDLQDSISHNQQSL